MTLSRNILAAAAAMALAVAGCGDDSDTNAGASGAAGVGKMTESAAGEVRRTVETHLKRPDWLGIEGSVASVPKNQTIAYVFTATPAAAITSKAAEQAVQALGWKIKQHPVKVTPESIQQGFDAALDDPATDAIISSTVRTSVVKRQLERAKSKEIPVAILNPDSDGEDDFVGIGGPDAYTYPGKLEADFILNQTKGDAQVLLALPAAYPTIGMLADSFKKEWAEKCPSCKKPLQYQAALTSFGTSFPGLLTAYLQAHRDVDYIVFGFNDMMIGVPAALKASGSNDVKAITWAQGPSTNSLLGKGLLEAEVGVPVVEFPWVAIDGLLRRLSKQPIDTTREFLGAGHPMHWIITKDTMDAAGLDPKKVWPLAPDYAQELRKLWGVDDAR